MPNAGTVTYEAISRMYALAALLLCNLDYAVAIEVGGCVAEVRGVGRAQGMLGACIGVGVEGCGADAVLGGGAADSSLQCFSSCSCRGL